MLKDTNTWKVLVVDDEEMIHDNLSINIRDITYLDKNIELLSAFSAAQAKQYISGYDDIAVIILDVMMESDQAGLEFVKYVREELKNESVRILMHTGQPGLAPKKEVCDEYAIEGYLDKNMVDNEDCYVSVKLAIKSYAKVLDFQKEPAIDDISFLDKISDAYIDLFSNPFIVDDYEKIVSKISSILHLSQQLLAYYALEDMKNDLTSGTTRNINLSNHEYSTLLDVRSIKTVYSSTSLEQYKVEKNIYFDMLIRAAKKFVIISKLSSSAKEKLQKVLETV